ncbi:hypothetical protein W02_24500 [Nitrospira sp. KM1]|uniref:hypothetical protein n=1 Tax=Nitrospira sp. KM1 TaxID=1936990 RepID=UPI0013A7811C|nr:hypothetical protein [Nitrospira sp. KM1]BCA55310.1 hypothetical protein W02_24500 [Nitrospira sp. KM1]
MTFQKGKQKTGGRKPGVQNRATLDIKNIALGFIQDPAYQASLHKRLASGKSPQLEVLLHYYAYGRPKVQIETDKSIRVLIDRAPQLDGPSQPPTIINPPSNGEDGPEDDHAS